MPSRLRSWALQGTVRVLCEGFSWWLEETCKTAVKRQASEGSCGKCPPTNFFLHRLYLRLIDFLLSLCHCGQGPSWLLLHVKYSLVRVTLWLWWRKWRRELQASFWELWGAVCLHKACQGFSWARPGYDSFISFLWKQLLELVSGQSDWANNHNHSGWCERWFGLGTKMKGFHNSSLLLWLKGKGRGKTCNWGQYREREESYPICCSVTISTLYQNF